MDTLSPEVRSRIMAANRGRDTGPELKVRSALHARGFRYRVDARDLPGRPDLKLTRYGALIFVNGCFWHGHDCAYFRPPQSNRRYWKGKIKTNRERDTRVIGELRDAGWRVCVIWECSLGKPASRGIPDALINAVSRWIRSNKGFLEIFETKATEEDTSAVRARASRTWSRNEDEARFAAERLANYRGGRGIGK
jgi:DNA mismatch endonuclease, patch repair protein